MDEMRNSVRDILIDSVFEDNKDRIKIYLHGIDIDGIPGDAKFVIAKEPLKIKYGFVFVASILGDFVLRTDYYESVDDLLDQFEEMMTYKFIGRYATMFVPLKEYEQQKIIYAYVCELKKKPMEECYVCGDSTFGHKTTCNHYICAYCFYKSLKPCDYPIENCEQCGEENAKFICGICRHTTNACEIHKFY
jgi:hypothetical protein